MMTSQILKSLDFTKKQKSRYLENETLFSLQIKNSLITHQVLLYGKSSFAAEVTFKYNISKAKSSRPKVYYPAIKREHYLVVFIHWVYNN